MEKTEPVVLQIHKLKNVSIRYFTTSIFFAAIGIITMTYSDTVLLNSFFVGLLEVIAGIFGALYCVHLIKNATLVNTCVSLAILFRIASYITDMVLSNYESRLLSGALTWFLIWLGFLISTKFVDAIQEIQNKNLNDNAQTDMEHEVSLRLYETTNLQDMGTKET